MNLIFLGAPGAGKGTQGALIAKRHGLARISSGDLLRDAVRRGTDLGVQAKSYMDAGELVPDDVMLALIRQVIARADQGFILDGFPRTEAQAEALDDVLVEVGRPLDHVIVLDVPDEVLVKRISGRQSCPRCEAVYNVHLEPPREPGTCDRCGGALIERADDDPATVQRRLQVFREQTRPLIAHYQEHGVPVHFVEGHQPVDDVRQKIETLVTT